MWGGVENEMYLAMKGWKKKKAAKKLEQLGWNTRNLGQNEARSTTKALPEK